MSGLRLMVFDDTCRPGGLRLGLTHSWVAGGWLYRALGRIDAFCGVRSWGEALTWLGSVGPGRPIQEIQYWGHGKWGEAFVDREVLDVHSLRAGHPHEEGLSRVRERLSGPEALWWFRTCETFGCVPGQRFAREWTDYFSCRAAGHTYIIGPWQSGLHVLEPGAPARWSDTEGLKRGTPQRPEAALWSRWREPNTITCLHGRIPEGF